MEIAVRKVKEGRMEDFVEARTNYINLLKQQQGVIVNLNNTLFQEKHY